ncbi:MAG: hypothetical protein ACFFE7_15830 [Candidatus Thorarchaeota archaeon]
MNERGREQRFDEVFQMILIIIALLFDILFTSEEFPLAEIAVFIWILTFWAYGNLKGGIWEYPLKLGSFNLSTTLMTNFYSVAIFGEISVLKTTEFVIAVIVLPFLCLIISLVFATYLKEFADRVITLPVLIGGTLGYILSVTAVAILR